jgi:hypothetical protein
MSVVNLRRYSFKTGLVKGSEFADILPAPVFPPGSPLVYTNPGNSTSYPGTGTTVFDLSGNGNNGTLTNGPTFNAGPPAYFDLDGTNDFINYGDIGDTYGSYTAINWVYFDTVSGFQSIMSKWSDTGGQRCWIVINNGGTLEAFWDRSGNFTNVRSFTSGGTFTTATWYMVVSAYDSSNGGCEAYVNNVSRGTATFSSAGDLFNSSSPLQLGLQGEPSRPLNGRMGEFLLYKSRLTAGELTSIFNTMKPTYGY